MGVKGLLTLVLENRKQLLKLTKLKDTSLIIDGHGICHILSESINPKSDYFGGNYDEFAHMCESFFEKLINCNITPYVFFDGVQDENKIKKTLHRLEERTERQRLISEGRSLEEENVRMLPILAYEALKSVLIDLKIRHRTCTWESDPQMAAFALELDCPIMTPDSDFFIYNIPKGVIVVDNLDLSNFKKCKKTGNYLEVEMYHISNFMFQIGLEEEDYAMIALLATVLGNDRRSYFLRFFGEANLPENCNNLTDTTAKKRVLKTLGWLQSKQKLSIAISDLVSYYDRTEREQLERSITRSIEAYTKPTAETVLKSPSMRSTFEELPKWFVDNFRKGKIPVPALAAIIGRPVILPPQVSVMGKPSPYQCCLQERKFIYRLLFGPGATHTIIEYDRDENWQLKPQYISFPHADGSVSIPSLNQIPNISFQVRLSVLLHILDLPAQILEKFKKYVFQEDEQLLIMTIILWLRIIEPPEDRTRYLITLLACFFRNRKFDSCLNVPGVVKSRSRFAILERYFELPSEINPTTFDCNVIHVFSQFQCCLQTVINLSQILCLSENAIHLVTGFNGTFVHNLYCKLYKVKLDPDYFMRNLFRTDAKFSETFNEIRRGIEETVLSCRSRARRDSDQLSWRRVM